MNSIGPYMRLTVAIAGAFDNRALAWAGVFFFYRFYWWCRPRLLPGNPTARRKMSSLSTTFRQYPGTQSRYRTNSNSHGQRASISPKISPFQAGTRQSMTRSLKRETRSMEHSIAILRQIRCFASPESTSGERADRFTPVQMEKSTSMLLARHQMSAWIIALSGAYLCAPSISMGASMA